MVEKTILHTPDMSCGHCVMTIERELTQMEGIETVSADLSTKTVILRHTDDEALERAKALLAEIGYPVVEH